MIQKKCCANCIRGIPVPVNNDILCREKGIVSRDYVCAKHRSTPGPKSFREMNYKCIHCENFIVNTKSSNSTAAVGLCRLFSVRQYVGEEKNACSKFIKRSEAANA